MAMPIEKVTVKEIKFMEADDTRVFFSNGTQLVGATSVSCKVSAESGQAEYIIKGTIHNFNNKE
jgi:competence transcription factor ComK